MTECLQFVDFKLDDIIYLDGFINKPDYSDAVVLLKNIYSKKHTILQRTFFFQFALKIGQLVTIHF